MIEPGRKGYIIAYDDETAVGIKGSVTTTTRNAFGQRCPDDTRTQLRMWKTLPACAAFANKMTERVSVEEIFPNDAELIAELKHQMQSSDAMLRTLFDCSHRTIWEDA